MPAEILSLDMDWFNYLKRHEIRSGIADFFATLKEYCVLPSAIDLVPEHHYLYPWSLKILEGLPYKKLNVVNIDEHHDFYKLRKKARFDDGKAKVNSANFFGFMVHQKLISEYEWVACQFTKTLIEAERRGLFADVRKAKSLTVRKFRSKIKVAGINDVFDVVGRRHFDGFIIVRSPIYTTWRRAVYHAVDEALRIKLPRITVRRYQCRTEFSSERVHHRADSLFWKV